MSSHIAMEQTHIVLSFHIYAHTHVYIYIYYSHGHIPFLKPEKAWRLTLTIRVSIEQFHSSQSDSNVILSYMMASKAVWKLKQSLVQS